jgi:SAM-dependent methyltransferase
MSGPPRPGEHGQVPPTGRAAAPYVDPALYDIVYSWYDIDLEFYLAAARAARGPVLEAACGTGRVLLPIRAAGVDIDGFDLEPAMIAHLEAKAQAAGIPVNVQVADLRDFSLPRRYTLVTIPFRAFMHLLTTDDQLRALCRIRDHLEPGGALVMNQFYPSVAIMAEREGRWIREREFTFPATGAMVTLWDWTHYDRVPQIAHCERKVVRSDTPDVVHYGFTLRWTYRFEMELLFRAAGFGRWQVHGGFDGRPFERDTDEMVWTAVRD